MSDILFQPYQQGALQLKNKVVMGPMTRSRAIDNLANEIMKTYYEQRSEAGLIITEGVSPSPNGIGYPRIPAVFSEKQAKTWKEVTEAVQAKGAKIFMQVMHTGRVSHPDNLAEGGEVLAPSAIAPSEPFSQMYVDGQGMLDIPTPKAMSLEDIQQAVKEYAESARLAVEVGGFDGIELHGANGYLINQFLNANSNQRTDEYGGNAENRSRFLYEVVEACIDAIGSDKVAVRISPYGVFNSMGEFDGIEEQFTAIASKLQAYGIAYLHTADMSAVTNVPVPQSMKQKLRENFKGTLILNGGYNKERATEDLEAGNGDLICFASSFIANPDLVTRMKEDLELSQPNQDTFYTPGPEGYTDYPKANS
ncbi:alkene reductase [Roseivirga sp.]|uniref:alkene reductase n=1 Tax=Roseivirga sp. TaxID=1964215 RepID=UPI003B51C7F7